MRFIGGQCFGSSVALSDIELVENEVGRCVLAGGCSL